MCGIVGYIGERKVAPVLLKGLSSLEYRGYDSAGIAYLENGELCIKKAKGRLAVLSEQAQDIDVQNTLGIGHTRWATHGEPSDINSHPHTNVEGDIAVVHNGIIENYLSIKEQLISEGVEFVSQTDTEVIAHLISKYYTGGLLQAVAKAVSKLKGSYAIAVISKEHPDSIVCLRKDSPLIIGVGENENFLASDIPAVLPYTKKVYYMEDGEIALVEKEGVTIYNETLEVIEKEIKEVNWSVEQVDKHGYPHFMIKEIHEQPQVLKDTLMPFVKNGTLDISSLNIDEKLIKGLNRIYVVACGTAYHAGVVGKYVMEKTLRINIEADIASEFRYRDPIIGKGDMLIVVSQSGETADTIAAMREARQKGAFCLAIVNVAGSTIAREADAVLHTCAGIEIAVASTKAYISQLMAFYILNIAFAKIRGNYSDEQVEEKINLLLEVVEASKEMIKSEEQMKKLAAVSINQKNLFYMGRGIDYALAMEASLKLKEISYIHSEAYAAGELKHGTIALIEQDTVVIGILTQNHLLDKTMGNLEEVKTRGARVVALAAEDVDTGKVAAETIRIPKIKDDMFYPLLGVIPMQLYAYYVSVLKGYDADKPRNLAKSVTVE